jgi:hypothetical protein
MNVRKFFFGLTLVFISIFLVAGIGVGFLLGKHTFQASIRGQITDTAGKPISGAKVELYIGGSDASENRFQCVTGQTGQYSIQTPTLRYALDSSAAYRGLKITADGYMPVSVKKRVAKGSNSGWNFILTKAISASGRLVNVKDEPVADSVLWFIPIVKKDVGSSLSYSSVWAKTDKEGNFTLDTAGPFEYRIVIQEHSMRFYRQKPVNGDRVDFSVESNRHGQKIRINDPQDFAVSGNVKDSEGNPLTKAYVWAYNEKTGTWGTYTDQHGAFSIIGLDGLGKDVFDIGIKGKIPSGKSYTMVIPGVRVGTEGLAVIFEEK